MPWGLPAAQVTSIVNRAVHCWHPPTRDHYLAALDEFVRYLVHARFSWPSDGRFPEASLVGYCDYLLSRSRLTGGSARLTVQSVRN